MCIFSPRSFFFFFFFFSILVVATFNYITRFRSEYYMVSFGSVFLRCFSECFYADNKTMHSWGFNLSPQNKSVWSSIYWAVWAMTRRSLGENISDASRYSFTP